MNMNHNPTKEQLQGLLRACDDRAAHHIAWISPGGDVHISPLSQEYTLSQWDRAMAKAYRVRMDEVFVLGGDYVGPAAAADPDWVEELYTWLAEAWRRPKPRRRATETIARASAVRPRG